MKDSLNLEQKLQDYTYDVNISILYDRLNFIFSSDCGSFGTHEILQVYNLLPMQLMDVLEAYTSKKIQLLIQYKKKEYARFLGFKIPKTVIVSEIVLVDDFSTLNNDYKNIVDIKIL